MNNSEQNLEILQEQPPQESIEHSESSNAPQRKPLKEMTTQLANTFAQQHKDNTQTLELIIGEVQKLEETVSKKDEQLLALQEQNKILQQEKESLENSIKKDSPELHSLLESAKLKMTLEEQNQTLQKERATLENRNHELLKEFDEKTRIYEEEKTSLKNENNELKKQIDSKEAQIKAFQQEEKEQKSLQQQQSKSNTHSTSTISFSAFGNQSKPQQTPTISSPALGNQQNPQQTSILSSPAFGNQPKPAFGNLKPAFGNQPKPQQIPTISSLALGNQQNPQQTSMFSSPAFGNQLKPAFGNQPKPQQIPTISSPALGNQQTPQQTSIFSPPALGNQQNPQQTSMMPSPALGNQQQAQQKASAGSLLSQHIIASSIGQPKKETLNVNPERILQKAIVSVESDWNTYFKFDVNKMELMISTWSKSLTQVNYISDEEVSNFSKVLIEMLSQNSLSLTRLDLSFFNCVNLTQKAFPEVAKIISNQPHLQHLKLGWTSTSLTDESFKEVARALSRQSQLHTLGLYCGGCNLTDNVFKEVGKILSSRSQLRNLVLNFSSCKQLTSNTLLELTEAISFLSLKCFSLNLDNTRLTENGIEASAQIFTESVKSLQELELNFQNCSQISDQKKDSIKQRLAKNIPKLKIL